MGLAVDATRLHRSLIFKAVVLFAAATLLLPAFSAAVAAEPSTKSKSTKTAKKHAKTSSKKKVAKATAKPVAQTGGKPAAKQVASKGKSASRKASVAKGSGSKKKVVATRSSKSGRRVASRSTRRGSTQRALAKAPRSRPPIYLPNVDDYQVLAVAARHLGTPYRFGGASAGGFDCSGLVRTVFAEVGTALPHSAREQFTMGMRVAPDELQPGDLVFFRTYRPGPSHVGIYMGDTLFIHAASRGGEVRVDSLEEGYFRSRYLGARRIRGSDS